MRFWPLDIFGRLFSVAIFGFIGCISIGARLSFDSYPARSRAINPVAFRWMTWQEQKVQWGRKQTQPDCHTQKLVIASPPKKKVPALVSTLEILVGWNPWTWNFNSTFTSDRISELYIQIHLLTMSCFVTSWITANINYRMSTAPSNQLAGERMLESSETYRHSSQWLGSHFWWTHVNSTCMLFFLVCTCHKETWTKQN